MRILVDAREAYRPRPRGTGKNLVDLYAALAALRPDWRITLLHEEDVRIPRLEGLANVAPRRATLPIPGAWRLDLWERARLPAEALRERPDVLHSPANTGPPLPLAPMVVTVHDLIPLEIAPDAPETRVFLRRVRGAVGAARRVVTPSEYSKGRICAVLGAPPEKVAVVPWAPDSKLRRVEDPAELDRVRAKYGLRPGQGYVFGFGASDPRKNTARVIEAYAALPAPLRAEFALLLVGIAEPALGRFRAQAAGLGLGEAARLHGFADEADLGALLSGAALLCFPSLSEGFGLPILDAFLCGAPVLTSDRTSLPEVAGDAGLTVDPTSTEALRDGLFGLLADAPRRRALAERGLERARSYTWEKVAERAAAVLEAAANARAA